MQKVVKMSDELKDALPNVELTDFTFEAGKLFVTYQREKRQVIRAKIWANGLHDLCICLNDNDVISIREIAKVAPEKILHRPFHDLLWLTFNQPIGTQNSLILEVNDSVKKLIHEMFQNFGPGKKAEDFEMYGGGNYG